MIENIRNLEKLTKQRLLTCEAEILFALADGGLTANELFIKTRNANTSFYMILKKLCDQKIINKQKDKFDKRMSRYYLSNSTNDLIRKFIQFSNIYNTSENELNPNINLLPPKILNHNGVIISNITKNS